MQWTAFNLKFNYSGWRIDFSNKYNEFSVWNDILKLHFNSIRMKSTLKSIGIRGFSSLNKIAWEFLMKWNFILCCILKQFNKNLAFTENKHSIRCRISEVFIFISEEIFCCSESHKKWDQRFCHPMPFPNDSWWSIVPNEVLCYLWCLEISWYRSFGIFSSRRHFEFDSDLKLQFEWTLVSFDVWLIPYLFFILTMHKTQEIHCNFIE